MPAILRFERWHSQQEKAKRINAAIAVTDAIDKALKFEFPMDAMNKTKEGRIINQILRQFGIMEMAKEALICLTAGATVSLARISAAVKRELLAMSSASLYTSPRNGPNPLARPTLGDFSSYFNITGDPPIGEQILDIILKALANGAFEIIKSIADMLKYNCEALFNADIGAMDAGEELKAHLQSNSDRTDVPAIDGGIADDFWNDPASEFADFLRGVSSRYGFPNSNDAFLYLSEVSLILSPDEICKLFNNSKDVGQNTLDKILQFNSTYTVGTVAQKMNYYNAIISFFADFSSQVDTTGMCNDYANDIASRMTDCVICIDEGVLADNQAVAELALIIDNGIEIPVPEPDFLCPESETFIDNPVLRYTIPNLFNTYMEAIQLQVGQSIEGVRTSLLATYCL